jgi:hypothetical protein
MFRKRIAFLGLALSASAFLAAVLKRLKFGFIKSNDFRSL